MRSVTSVAVVSGPLVALGYVAGALAATASRRTRRGRPGLNDVLFEAFTVLAAATAAWYVVEAVSPGSNYPSRVALQSDQVLIAWQSVALWTGLGCVVGQVAPVFRKFEGNRGLVAAGALLAAYAPALLAGSVAAGFAATLVSRRSRYGIAAAIASLIPLSWLAWVLDWAPAWGLTLGPEVSLWSTVLAGVLGVRWWADRARGDGPIR